MNIGLSELEITVEAFKGDMKPKRLPDKYHCGV